MSSDLQITKWALASHLSPKRTLTATVIIPSILLWCYEQLKTVNKSQNCKTPCPPSNRCSFLISNFSKKCQIKDIWLFVDYFHRSVQKTDYIIISGKTVISSLWFVNLLKLALRNTPLSSHQPTRTPMHTFERTLLQVTLKDNFTQKWKFIVDLLISMLMESQVK